MSLLAAPLLAFWQLISIHRLALFFNCFPKIAELRFERENGQNGNNEDETAWHDDSYLSYGFGLLAAHGEPRSLGPKIRVLVVFGGHVLRAQEFPAVFAKHPAQAASFLFCRATSSTSIGHIGHPDTCTWFSIVLLFGQQFLFWSVTEVVTGLQRVAGAHLQGQGNWATKTSNY